MVMRPRCSGADTVTQPESPDIAMSANGPVSPAALILTCHRHTSPQFLIAGFMHRRSSKVSLKEQPKQAVPAWLAVYHTLLSRKAIAALSNSPAPRSSCCAFTTSTTYSHEPCSQANGNALQIPMNQLTRLASTRPPLAPTDACPSLLPASACWCPEPTGESSRCMTCNTGPPSSADEDEGDAVADPSCASAGLSGVAATVGGGGCGILKGSPRELGSEPVSCLRGSQVTRRAAGP